MQFKQVKGKIQVLAYRGYDKNKKRAIVKMLGSIDDYNLLPSVGLEENLTDDEKKELQSYLDKRRQSRQKASRQSYAHRLDKWIDEAAEGLEAKEIEINPDHAKRLYNSMAKLSKALNRAGHPKPKKGEMSNKIREIGEQTTA